MSEFTPKDISRKYTPRSYRYVLRQGKPFDLIMSASGSMASDFIKKTSSIVDGRGDFSHVGILVTREIFPNFKELKNGKLYIWECLKANSDGNKKSHVVKGGGKYGVQIRDLEAIVNEYSKDKNKYIAWLQLINNPWCKRKGENGKVFTERRDWLIERMQAFYLLISEKYYERDYLGLVTSAIPQMKEIHKLTSRFIYNISLNDQVSFTDFVRILFTENRPDSLMSMNNDNSRYKLGNHYFETLKLETSEWLFCSEMVVIIYREIGNLSDDVDPAIVMPIDLMGNKEKHIDKFLEYPILINP